MTQPIPKHHAYGIERRRLLQALVAGAANCGGHALFAAGRLDTRRIDLEEVIPRKGIKSRFVFGDSVRKLIAAGVLDPGKYRTVMGSNRGLPDWVERLFTTSSAERILFSQETAPYLLNLLWPLGLATRTTFNARSPINTVRLPSFASTAGWTLGQARNGYVYFNQVDTVHLTPWQEAQALGVATRTFRPCCDNSTFFQDCNHGSALLGLIELAASQGASEDELYRVALTANSYWFPTQYAVTALYFVHFQHLAWNTVPPQRALSAAFSSASGWQGNVTTAFVQGKMPPPATTNAALSCGMRR